MNLRQCILSIFLFGLLAACGEEKAAIEDPVSVRFNQQLWNSCEEMVSYSKRVTSPEAPAKDSLFQSGVRFSRANCLLNQEMKDALTYIYYSDPSAQDEYEIQQNGDTIQAMLKAPDQSNLDLKWQQIVMESDSTLQYIRSRIVKSNWLYDHRIEIAVSFDSTGRYLSHWLEIGNDVSFINEGFEARIEGRANYD